MVLVVHSTGSRKLTRNAGSLPVRLRAARKKGRFKQFDITTTLAGSVHVIARARVDGVPIRDLAKDRVHDVYLHYSFSPATKGMDLNVESLSLFFATDKNSTTVLISALALLATSYPVRESTISLHSEKFLAQGQTLLWNKNSPETNGKHVASL